MGNITDQMNYAARDFVTDGVQSSGNSPVDKAEMRKLGPMIEAAITAAGLGALVDVSYATRSQLYADLAHAADSVGLVSADGTLANVGLYTKSGASGSGSWTQTTSFLSMVEALVTDFIDEAEGYADSAEATRALTEALKDEVQDLVTGANESLPLSLDVRMKEVESRAGYAGSSFAMATYQQTQTLSILDKLAAIERGDAPALLLGAKVRNYGWDMELIVAETSGGGLVDVSLLQGMAFEKGFNRDLQPCVNPQAFHPTRVRRKPYPDFAERYEISGTFEGVTVSRILVSLSRPIYAKAKAGEGNSGFDPFITARAGWYYSYTEAQVSEELATLTLTATDLTDLNTQLAYDADTIAVVSGGISGIYRKSGASGAGDWTRLADADAPATVGFLESDQLTDLAYAEGTVAFVARGTTGLYVKYLGSNNGAWLRIGDRPEAYDAGLQDGVMVENNSVLPYGVPAPRHGLPPHRKLGAVGRFEICGNGDGATAGRTYAAVLFELTGLTSGIVRRQTVNEFIASDYYTQRTCAAPVYPANFDMTAFMQGERVRCDVSVYPWIGDTPCHSADGTYLDGDFCSYTHLVDHEGTYGSAVAWVSKSGANGAPAGNDGTGAAATSEAAAKATPFATETAAMAAAVAFNLSEHGRDNSSGVEIIFTDESHTRDMADSPSIEEIAGPTWAVWRAASDSDGSATLARNTSVSNGIPRRVCLRNLTLDLVPNTGGNTIMFDGNELDDGSLGKELWLDNSPFVDGGVANINRGIRGCGMVYMTDMDIPAVSTAWIATGARQEVMLVRNVDISNSLNLKLDMWCWLGLYVADKDTDLLLNYADPSLNPYRIEMDGIVWGGVLFRCDKDGTNSTGMFSLAEVADTVKGISMVNVAIEMYGRTGGDAYLMGINNEPLRSRNVWIDYATFIGQRVSFGYEDGFGQTPKIAMTDDGDGQQQLKYNMVIRRSVLPSQNTKGDMHAELAEAIHNQNVMHRVGWKYVGVVEIDSNGKSGPGTGHWGGEAWPNSMSQITTDPRTGIFEDYRADSLTGGVGLGGTDFTPAAGSPLLNVIAANDEACACDLFGNPRNGSIGAVERVAA